jgi:hypothetical protein
MFNNEVSSETVFLFGTFVIRGVSRGFNPTSSLSIPCWMFYIPNFIIEHSLLDVLHSQLHHWTFPVGCSTFPTSSLDIPCWMFSIRRKLNLTRLRNIGIASPYQKCYLRLSVPLFKPHQTQCIWIRPLQAARLAREQRIM